MGVLNQSLEGTCVLCYFFFNRLRWIIFQLDSVSIHAKPHFISTRNPSVTEILDSTGKATHLNQIEPSP